MLLSSCSDDDGVDGVPSYIRVESFDIETTTTEGTDRQDIKDVWVQAGNNFIGAFELPATIPILKEGPTDLELRAGVLQDGISTTRSRYPFLQAYDITTNLEKKEVKEIEPVVGYNPRTDFIWMERFASEDNLTIEETNDSHVEFEITQESDEVYEGDGSFKATLEEEGNLIEVASKETFQIDPNQPAFMELHYRSDIEIRIGAIAHIGNEIRPVLKMGLNPNEEWTKIYVYLSDFIGNNVAPYPFRIFIGARNPNNETNEVFLDNIKLLRFE